MKKSMQDSILFQDIIAPIPKNINEKNKNRCFNVLVTFSVDILLLKDN
jgi:hypothetical protein